MCSVKYAVCSINWADPGPTLLLLPPLQQVHYTELHHSTPITPTTFLLLFVMNTPVVGQGKEVTMENKRKILETTENYKTI